MQKKGGKIINKNLQRENSSMNIIILSIMIEGDIWRVGLFLNKRVPNDLFDMRCH